MIVQCPLAGGGQYLVIDRPTSTKRVWILGKQVAPSSINTKTKINANTNTKTNTKTKTKRV